MLLAVAVEGAPPAVSPSEILAFSYVSVVATALAFVCWFAGLSHLEPAAVGVIGLLNPVTGVALGATLAAEPISVRQAAGIALVIGGILAAQNRTDPGVSPPALRVVANAVGGPQRRMT